MKFGYVRVRAGEDTLSLQIDALRAAGAEAFYQDHGVAASAVLKPAYIAMLRAARVGDEIMVWRLDRLSRSLTTLVTELRLLDELGLGFHALTEKIGTGTEAGGMFFPIVRAFARFEQDTLRDRVQERRETGQRA